MPMYDYECEACHEQTSILCSFSEWKESIPCEECPNGVMTQRILGAPAVRCPGAPSDVFQKERKRQKNWEQYLSNNNFGDES